MAVILGRKIPTGSSRAGKNIDPSRYRTDGTVLGSPAPAPSTTPATAPLFNAYGNNVNLDREYQAGLIRASFAKAGQTLTDENLNYLLGKVTKPDLYSDNKWRVGWNAYFDERVRTQSGSANPGLAGTEGVVDPKYLNGNYTPTTPPASPTGTPTSPTTPAAGGQPDAALPPDRLQALASDPAWRAKNPMFAAQSDARDRLLALKPGDPGYDSKEAQNARESLVGSADWNAKNPMFAALRSGTVLGGAKTSGPGPLETGPVGTNPTAAARSAQSRIRKKAQGQGRASTILGGFGAAATANPARLFSGGA